jgi:cyclophilin family peptidyl-prolyl cis-trans isomerase
MSKRARDRQLAKLAQRRAAERRAARRRRTALLGVLGLIAAAGLAYAGFNVLTGDDPTAPVTPSVSAPPTSEPGSQTGTVEPGTAPDEVACGGLKPDAADTPKPQFSAPPALTIDTSATYTATFETSCGDILVELLAERAPETVNSFVFLAQEGYFDGTRIHRLDTSLEVIQGGDPVGTGTSGPGYTIPDELQGGESYGPGVFAMANSGSPDSGGSQFFLITGENGHRLDADPAYTIFGNVIEGLAVAREIQALPIQDPDAAAAGDISGQQPAQAIYIEKVTISGGD